MDDAIQARNLAGSECFAKVVRVLSEDRGVSVGDITPSTRLFEDLGLYGDDAEEFFLALQEKCGPIDFSALDFRQYFGDECGGVWPWRWTDRNRHPLAPVTVKRIVAVVESGKWFDPSSRAV